MKATPEQLAQADTVTRHGTATRMLCTEAQWLTACKLLKDSGVHHAVIHVSNNKGGYEACVPHTDQVINHHDHLGNVTILASTKDGREYCV